MARAIRQIVLGLAAGGLLAGCVEATDPVAGAAADTAGPANARRGKAQDVEAPEVFQISETALWDGRPSLGGIWVASPDTTDPERVVMVNPANGKQVTGALFRRERDNPGPTLQLSSDAAEALGILAGQPAEIRVTALRKAEAVAPAPDEPVAETVPETAADPEPEVAAATPEAEPDAAAAAIAAAALAAVDAGTDAAGAAADAAVADGTDVPAKKTWKERRAEAKAARVAARAARTAAAAAATAAATDTTEATEIPEAAAAVSAIETAPLDARSPDVAAAAEAAPTAEPAPVTRKTRRQIRAEEAAAAAAAITPAEPTAEAPAETPAAAARTIQAASFSSEANANRAVADLAKAGITATTRKGDSAGKAIWGVVAMGDAALLAAIRKAGYADAFFLK